MAAAFNLTAQINLQGPKNIKPIIADIKRQISSAKIGLNLDIGADSAKNISSITRRLNNLSKAAIQANTNVSNLGNTLSSLSSSFNTASSAANTHASSTARTAQAVASAGKAVQQTRTQIEEFGKQAGLAVKRFAAFSTVTAPIYALTNAITNGFKEFVNFNKEIVRLSQVTGQSVSDLGAVSKEITRLSTSLGVASSDLLQVATTLAQAGFSAEETKVALEALAKSALAPSFDSLADTTEGAIAAMRQFGIQARELDGALGSINAVAAAFAVEASDIITAVQRTGGVFSAASRGVSEGTDALNEFIAIFTSVRATTRESAETIATGLRTIFTRIQRAKTIEQLREFGIELQDTEGKFVGLYEATRRLSEGLSRIDPRSIGFATISEELGGFRQIGKVIPLIQQFSVAEQALAVAQKGTKSTSKDALIAQQSLAVQFEKTRQNFLGLIREIGDSSSFKAFVGLSLKLADAFINVGKALKPLLPLILLYSSIKAGGAIKEFGAGFGGVFGFGGGKPPPGGTGGTGGPAGTGGPSGGSASTNATALANNTTVLNVVAQTLTNLNTSILALNQNIVNNNSLLLNRPTSRFASGGIVPGSGKGDKIHAMLEPGEVVLNNRVASKYGRSNLNRLNKGSELIQKFPEGSPRGVGMSTGKGRGVKKRKGSRRAFRDLTPEEMAELDTDAFIRYANDQAYDVLSRGGAGLSSGPRFIPVPPERITDELRPYLEPDPNNPTSGVLGYKKDSADFIFGTQAKPKARKQRKMDARTLRTMAATAGGVDKSVLAGVPFEQILKYAEQAPRPTEEAKRAALARYASDPEFKKLMGEETGIKGGFLKQFEALAKQKEPKFISAQPLIEKIPDAEDRLIAFRKSLETELSKEQDAKLKKSLLDKVVKANNAIQEIRAYKKGVLPTVPGRVSHFAWAMRQAIPESKDFANGGLVQKFVNGGKAGLSDELLQNISATGSYENYINQQMTSLNPNQDANNKVLHFGLVGLQSGTKREQPTYIEKPISKKQRVGIHIGFLQDNDLKNQIAENINNDLKNIIEQTGNAFQKKLKSPGIGSAIQKQVLDGATLASAAGSIFESSLQMVGAPYIDKIESLKSMDFPFGVGDAAPLFGSSFPSNIPTDATRTIAGKGKGISDFVGQIKRFLKAMRKGSFTKAVSENKLPTLMNPNDMLVDSLMSSVFSEVKDAQRRSDFNNIAADFTTGSIRAGSPLRVYGFTKGPYKEKNARALREALLQSAKLRSDVQTFLGQKAQTQNKGGTIGMQKFAFGGSPKDTVTAMVSKDEGFVPPALAKKVGYATLDRMNQADRNGMMGFAEGGISKFKGPGTGTSDSIGPIGLPKGSYILRAKAMSAMGFNKGGAVGMQKFAAGGSVIDAVGGGAGAIAAITAIILPEMEKLAESFKKLDGQSASLAAGLSGATKQASSLVLSAGIALQVSGADKRTTGLTQAGLGITGAIGGFMTEKSSKDLERALLKTSEKFSDFDKTLQDLTQAPTEELRIEAASRLEKTFMDLDASVRNSIPSIDSLEFAQKAGESLNNFSLSVITGISAFSALKTATEAMVASANARVAMAAPLAAGVAGPVGPAVGIGTKLLANFGGLIPIIGLLIPAISAAVEGFSLWTSTAKKSAEQLDKVYSSLAELTKNSNAFNLANQNFTTKLLPEFRKLRESNPKQLKERLGDITTDNGFNELNLNFKTLLRSRFAEKGLTFNEEQNLSDFQREISTTAAGVKLFDQVVADTTKEFERQQFIQAKRATNKELTPEEAGKQFDKLLKGGKDGRREIDRVNKEFVGAANLEILALRDLTDANNRVKLSLVNLDNILVSLGAKINMSIDKALNSFDDLDLKIATMSGEPEQIGGRFLRRDISVLENIGGATEQQIKDVTSTVRGLIQVQPGTTEATRFGEIATQVQAVRTFQQDLPTVLRTIQTTGGLNPDKIFKALEENLGSELRTIAGTGEEADKSVNTILRDASAQLYKAVQGDKESITNMEDLARNAPALAAALKNGETSVKVFKDVLEASAKLQDKLAEQQKRLVELNNQLNQSIIQRTQTELQNSIELKRVFGENIKLSELNNVFDAGIRQLSNIGRGVPSGGTTNVGIISSELDKAKKSIAEFDRQIELSRGNQAKTKDLTDKRNKEVIIVNRLTQALSTLATSSDKTKNALDKIAEAQDKFTKRRNFLSEYLDAARNNPEKFLQMQKTVASVRSAETGRFMDATQARLFVTEGASVLEQMGRSRAEIDALINRAVEFQAKGARPLNKNDQNIIDDTIKFLRSGGKSPLDAMASQLPVFLKPLVGSFAEKFNIDAPESALAKAQSEQKAAADELIKNLNERIGAVTSTTDDIFTSFNNELGLVLPGIIEKLRLLEGKSETTTTQATKPPEFKPSAGLIAEFQAAIKERPNITSEDSKYPGAQLAVTDFLTAGPLADTSKRDAMLMADPVVALSRIDEELKTQMSNMPEYRINGSVDPEKYPDIWRARGVISDLKGKFSRERKAFEESQQNKVEPQTPQLPPGPPTTNRPTGTSRVSNNNNGTQFVSDTSIQKFQEGANAFSKSLNDAPLQNLSDSLSSFNSTSQALIKSLQSFEAKFSEGMKGNVSHNASVQVSFADSLAVDLPKNNNTISMVDMVVNAIRPLIATEITRGLKREV